MAQPLVGKFRMAGTLSQAFGPTDPMPPQPGNAGVVWVDVGTVATIGVQVTGTFAGDLVPEVSIDYAGRTPAWVAAHGEDVTTGMPLDDVAAPGSYRFDVAGFAAFRLRCAAVASGSAAVVLVGTSARSNLNGAVVAAVAGLAGSSSASQSYTAGVVISGNSIVRLASGMVYPADAETDSATALQSVLGMTAGAAQAGAQVTVVRAGPVPGMAGLTPDAVYFLGANGGVTTTVPTTGTLVIVGTAQSATTFNVRVSPPVAINT